MGRKHSRQRKHFFLYFACWLSFSLASAGCAPFHKPYGGEQLPLQKPSEEKQLLLRAKSSFARGDFLTAIKENQEILNRFPEKYGDHALYAMGLIYAYPEYPDAKNETSMTFFKKLIREYPESVFKNQAKIWISILNQAAENEKEMDKKRKQIDWLENALKAEKKQIKNLQNQIKSLKEIDLGIEEKKREALPEIGK
ncbi:MAG TPA: hypothetical protein VMW06_03240 [Desulfobacterales bacterium]|nr:hypothetical protein [Desulfobacterales bacterium]